MIPEGQSAFPSTFNGKPIVQVSVTEIQEYMRCKRQWDYGSANRQSLVRKGAAYGALSTGTIVHKGIEAQAMGKDPFAVADEYIAQQKAEMEQAYLERVGTTMSPVEYEPFTTSMELAKTYLRNYLEHYGQDTWAPFKLLHPEVTMRIPFYTAQGDLYAWLVGTCDGLLQNPSTRNLWVGETKTFSQRPQLRDLLLDHQIIGYPAMIQMLTGHKVEGVLYNGINKKLPVQPKKLQSGLLSREWIDTTESAYIKAIKANGDNPGDEYYRDILNRLRQRDQSTENPFYVRHRITIPQSAVVEWVENVEKILWEIANDPLITFNKPWTGCWDCDFRDLCDGQLRGEDVQWITQANYKRGTYGTQKALAEDHGETQVGSLADLLKAVEISR